MDSTSGYQGTLNYIQSRWPRYLLGFAGIGAAAILVIYISLGRGWYAYVTMSGALLIILAYFCFATLWAAHRIYDGPGIGEMLVSLGELRPEEDIALVSPGLGPVAVTLSRRMTSGKLLVIDIYNPQLMPSRTLARTQNRVLKPQKDPRLAWRDGTVNLLPKADGTAAAVVAVETVSELWQRGDQLQLLKEIERILAPDGRLIMAERIRSLSNFLVLGPIGLRLKSGDYWRDLLREAGFVSVREMDRQELIHCFRATKPSAGGGQQLSLEL